MGGKTSTSLKQQDIYRVVGEKQRSFQGFVRSMRILGSEGEGKGLKLGAAGRPLSLDWDLIR